MPGREFSPALAASTEILMKIDAPPEPAPEAEPLHVEKLELQIWLENKRFMGYI